MAHCHVLDGDVCAINTPNFIQGIQRLCEKYSAAGCPSASFTDDYCLLEIKYREGHEQPPGNESIGSISVTNLLFATGIVGLAKTQNLVSRLDRTSSTYGIKINTEQSKFMTKPRGWHQQFHKDARGGS